MNKSRPIPDQVVRFYGNPDFALDAIGTQEITLVHSSLLNDPFDPYLFFETDFGEDYGALADYVRAKHPNDFGWFINYMTVEWWKEAVPKLRSYFLAIKKALYMFSTSAVYTHAQPSPHSWLGYR